ncbi:MAG: stage V sporulation protein AD [Clostridia bacterium]|nr:stage V sporulation protein AD [Clostridia bacterium]
MANRIGKYTLFLPSRPSVHGYAAVVGRTEGEGPLAQEFDYCYTDDSINGCPSWEKAESALQREAITRAIAKAGLSPEDVNLIMAGDLLDQCIGTSFGIRELQIPFLGLYGACSTMALSMGLASVLVDSGAVNYAVASTSSHFASAERQFRLPLEYGGQRPPSAQRTATASGASVIAENKENFPCVEAVIFGKIMDLGIKDANNMGAAMAPAAASTIGDFLNDTRTSPTDYDMILTGDLGSVGAELLIELLKKDYGYDISSVHGDCGLMIYDIEAQDVHAGGSGCGCSGSVVNSYIMRQLKEKTLKRVLFVGTGALLSPTSTMQGESIPSIAHGVLLTSGDE